jgi:hypothetical protein
MLEWLVGGYPSYLFLFIYGGLLRSTDESPVMPYFPTNTFTVSYSAYNGGSMLGGGEKKGSVRLGGLSGKLDGRPRPNQTTTRVPC